MTFQRPLVLVLLLLLGNLQTRLWFGDGGLSQVDSLAESIEHRSSENERARQRNAILAAETKDLKQGLETVEDIARNELGLIRQGETFFLVADDRLSR